MFLLLFLYVLPSFFSKKNLFRKNRPKYSSDKLSAVICLKNYLKLKTNGKFRRTFELSPPGDLAMYKVTKPKFALKSGYAKVIFQIVFL